MHLSRLYRSDKMQTNMYTRASQLGNSIYMNIIAVQMSQKILFIT